MVTSFQIIHSPVADLRLIEENDKLIGLHFLSHLKNIDTASKSEWVNQETPLLAETRKQLTEYFEGKRKAFTLPIKLSGTDFRMRAWQALMEIPYGTTISYSDQAKKLGGINYSRAVGQANHHNPIVIIVPCHRVIGKSGKLIGFGGGLSVKEKLINLEESSS